MKLLLDTCCILWTVAAPDRLSPQAKELLENPEAQIFISVISCAEIACASYRGQIELDRHWKRWFRHYIGLNGWRSVPIDLEISEESYSLPEPFHQDPADRIIVATARLSSCSVITADSRILSYPHVNSVW